MRQQSFDVLVIGGTMEDLHCTIPSSSEGFAVDHQHRRLSLSLDAKLRAKVIQVSLGGGAANAAVACARLGLMTGLVSALGRDPIAEALLRILKQERVNTSLISHVALEPTGVSVVLVDETSGEQTSFYAGGASRFIEVTEDVQKTLHTTAWVYITSLGEAQEENLRALLAALEKESTRVALVPGSSLTRNGTRGLEALLARADVIVMTEEEAQAFLGRPVDDAPSLAAGLQALGPTSVALTRGRNGAFIRSGTEELTLGDVSTTVVDTIGAGDAFASTLVAGMLLYPDDLRRAARAAEINAASVVSASTAQKGLLSRAALEERLRGTSGNAHGRPDALAGMHP